jgi:alpha-tubulin suppressor-like RCC1 family protein
MLSLWISLAAAAPLVAAGAGHSCRVDAGIVRCWGGIDAAAFRLPPGDPARVELIAKGSPQPTPTVIALPGLATAISAGGSTTCAILEGGAVWCWEVAAVPVVVAGVDATAVSVGKAHTCVIERGGTVACWGYNRLGQLGDGTTTDSPAPKRVPGVRGVKTVASGGYHTCTSGFDGSVWCWGAGDRGQLGGGAVVEARATPGRVSFVTDAVQVAAGTFHTCALRPAGVVVCWGDGMSGQLGNGVRAESAVAVVAKVTGASELSAGFSHTCATHADGSLDCWGSNEFLQCGGEIAEKQFDPKRALGLTDVAHVAAGAHHTCVATAGGEVRCFGDSATAQLGDGVAGSPRPVVDVPR